MTAGARIIQLQEIKDEILRDFPHDDNAAQAAGKLDNANSYLSRLAVRESPPADDGAASPQTEPASSNGAASPPDGGGA